MSAIGVRRRAVRALAIGRWMGTTGREGAALGPLSSGHCTSAPAAGFWAAGASPALFGDEK
jgi:hypothetical protein